MAGAIRRQARKAGSKVAAGAKVVGFWAKRGAQLATGARLSARVMEKVPQAGSSVSVNRTTHGAFTRIHSSMNEIERNQGGTLVRYDVQGRRIKSTKVTGGDRVVIEKDYKPGALLPRRVERRFQKR